MTRIFLYYWYSKSSNKKIIVKLFFISSTLFFLLCSNRKISQINREIKDEVSRAYSKVVVVFSASNAGGDIGPAIDLFSSVFVPGIAIGHMLGAKDVDNQLTRFGDRGIRGG